MGRRQRNAGRTLSPAKPQGVPGRPSGTPPFRRPGRAGRLLLSRDGRGRDRDRRWCVHPDGPRRGDGRRGGAVAPRVATGARSLARAAAGGGRPGPRPGAGRTGDLGACLWPRPLALRHANVAAGASQAVDILLALAESRPGVLAGASVQAMATLVGLALEIVGAGRLIPGLYLDEKGCYTARWEPISGGDDEARLRLIVGSLPPVCRALGPTDNGTVAPNGQDPLELARHVLNSFVDAVCRDSFRTSGAVPGPGLGPGARGVAPARTLGRGARPQFRPG